MEIIFQYPIWFLAFCFLLGFVYSIALYFKSNDFDEENTLKHLKVALALLRFLSVSLLSFLLLSPSVKTRHIDKVLPKIVVVHDNSSSINLSFKNLDSTKYINNLRELYKAIENKYELDIYSFSDKIEKNGRLNFSDKKTNISNILTELNGIYYNQNIGAVILATDGIYTEGQNPFYTDFSFPIFPIALGDTNLQNDLKISNVRANKIAYLNDKLNVEIDLEAYNVNAKNFKLSVFKNHKGKQSLVKSKNIEIKNNHFEKNTSFIINANSIGTQHYTVVVSKLKNEITYENNRFDFYVEVIDSRQKILILANAPHPDIAVLKQTIDLNKNLDFTIQYINEHSEDVSKFDLIILHQLPSLKFTASNVFTEIKKSKIPYWIITGVGTDYFLLNKHQEFINITPKADNQNEVNAIYNSNFNIFTLNDKTRSRLQNFPPLKVPFADFKTTENSKILLFQQIGSVNTDFPILSFNESFGLKSAIFIGDGLWRWKMYDYLENKNHDAFNEIFQKTINFLALKTDKRKFRVSTTKKLFYEGEPTIISAELYNENYELINKPEVTLELINEKEEKFPLAFTRTNNSYQIKTNNLPVGNYTYKAKTIFSSKNYISEGAFGIKTLQIEALQTQANHKILYQLANKTNGIFFYPNKIAELQKLLLDKEDIRPTLYESFKTRSIINLRWIFFLILGLLSVEWFIRKYNGAY